jgi:hypothetical protein
MTEEDDHAPEPVDPTLFPSPITRASEGTIPRIRVLLHDLVWGGELVPVPTPFVVGTVVGGKTTVDRAKLLQVDFGAHLGVQELPIAVCEEIEQRKVDSVATDAFTNYTKFDIGMGPDGNMLYVGFPLGSFR